MSETYLFGAFALVAGFAVWHPWKGAVRLLGGWALLGVVWLGLVSGVYTLLNVSCSWAHALTWRVSGTKLYSGL